MKFSLPSALLFVLTATIAQAFAAEEFGTAKEAEAMVNKAVAHIKKAGKEPALADFTAKKPPFSDRDLYVIVTDMNGTSLAHGQNPKMVGKNLADLKDPDGKAFYKERMELAKAKHSFWQEYRFTDPVSKRVLPKSTYCEREEDMIVCVGTYKH